MVTLISTEGDKGIILKLLLHALTFANRSISPVHFISSGIDGTGLVIGCGVVNVVPFNTLDLTVGGVLSVARVGCYVAIGRLYQHLTVLDVTVRADARPCIVPEAVSHRGTDKREAVITSKCAVGVCDLTPRARDGSVLGRF